MHKQVLALFATSLLACRSEPPLVDQQPRPKLEIPIGGARPVRTMLPATGNQPAPLILVLHGYGGGASDVLPWSGLSALSNKPVHLIAPEGTADSSGRRFWNANSACCDFDDRRPDDLHYLLGVVDDFSARYEVDAKRVYVVGLSNGGSMAMRLACEAPERFAAIVSFAGPTAPDEPCAAKLPISIRLVHGTADRVVPYEGGPRLAPVNPKAKGLLAAVRDVGKAWAVREGCTDNQTFESSDYVPSLPGEETHIAKYAGCSGGAVELATVEGGGHVPALGPRFAESTWSFLSSHSR